LCYIYCNAKAGAGALGFGAMKTGLWRPPHEGDEAFLQRSRQLAMPIAYGLLFLMVVLFLWACWTLSALFLT
jgi:hypothetical protein